MPASQSLALFEENTDTITVTVTKAADGTPEDITGATIEVFFKTSASMADDDLSTVKASTADSSVTITDGPNGKAMFNVPADAVASPVSKFWRLDVVNGTSRRTALYGPVTITDL